MEITYEILRETMTYNQETGYLLWSARPSKYFKTDCGHKAWNTKFSGKIAGHISPRQSGNAYINIQLFGKMYKAHRLVWLYVNGTWPKEEIDHVDGNGLNNRIENLRDVSRPENRKNIKRTKANTSGFMGVCWKPERKAWTAKIKINGKVIYLGTFKNKFHAAEARRAAERHHGFHKNHGTKRTNSATP